MEARLQETVSAFEKSRDAARKAKADFEKVKKDRLVTILGSCTALYVCVHLL